MSQSDTLPALPPENAALRKEVKNVLFKDAVEAYRFLLENPGTDERVRQKIAEHVIDISMGKSSGSSPGSRGETNMINLFRPEDLKTIMSGLQDIASGEIIEVEDFKVLPGVPDEEED